MNIDISDMLNKAMNSSTAQNMMGMCGIPKEGLRISLTASAEMIIEPVNKEVKKDAKPK